MYQGGGSHPGSGELKTLWVGDIEPWMDEIYLLSMFAHTREVVQVKVIRDKTTGLSAGYGFVEFQTYEAARIVLETHNGQPVPSGSGKLYRLNWASYGINERKPETCDPEYSIFVGDLAPDINDYTLQQVFAEYYTSVKSAKVVTDSQTGLSRGYGFVRFGSEQEMKRAMSEMQGHYCGSRPMRINAATPKRSEQPTVPPLDLSDPTNTTVFIGGLDPHVTEADLKRFFAPFGDIVYVKIPYGKGCGFVQYTTRASAEAAFTLHGSYIGNQKIRLSWGRSASSSPQQHHTSTFPQYNGMAMGGGQASSHNLIVNPSYAPYCTSYVPPPPPPPTVNDYASQQAASMMLHPQPQQYAQMCMPPSSPAHHQIAPSSSAHHQIAPSSGSQYASAYEEFLANDGPQSVQPILSVTSTDHRDMLKTHVVSTYNGVANGAVNGAGLNGHSNGHSSGGSLGRSPLTSASPSPSTSPSPPSTESNGEAIDQSNEDASSFFLQAFDATWDLKAIEVPSNDDVSDLKCESVLMPLFS